MCASLNSSRGSADSGSASSGPDTSVCGRTKSIRLPARSTARTGQMERSTKAISGPSIRQLSLPMSCFAEDSPASRSRLPESGKRKRTTAGSGPKSFGSLARLGPDGFFWKTSPVSYLPTMETPSQKFSGTWPRAGSMSNGTVFRRPSAAPPISGIASFLLPTPTTVDTGSRFNRSASAGAARRPTLGAMAKFQLWPTPNVPNGGRVVPKAAEWRGKTAYYKGKKVQVGLEHAVRMWPTPQATDGKGANPRMAEAMERHKAKGSRKQVSLRDAVKLWPTPRPCSGKGSSGANRTEFYRRMFPTPIARDCRSLKGAKRPKNSQGSEPLVVQVGGQLNADWVEALMGFPVGWTDVSAGNAVYRALPASKSTESSGSVASATRSSRKSSTGSVKGSRKSNG
jgi:hypothetical protein